jgi:hypothetical protein
MPTDRPSMLAVVSRFKWIHIAYLEALGEHFDLHFAWAGEGHAGAAQRALAEGLRGVAIGSIKDVGIADVRSRLRELISVWQPDVVHVMYYRHEELTLLVRELAGEYVPIVHECRDPLTVFSAARRAGPGSTHWTLERAAVEASDAQIFVSESLRAYIERTHGLDLAATSLIVPQAFARRVVAPPSTKLSSRDGRLHIALVGTADDEPDHGRWYVDIIRRLVGLGLVVHSHFHDLERVSLDPYRRLDTELDDYYFHPAIKDDRTGPALSSVISRYDLMGVFHELEASHHNESACLAVCLPCKAVCGWLHGGIPAVCFPHYAGVVERIEELGIGFVIERWEDLVRIAADRRAIARATAHCLECRDTFTTEYNAERIRRFVQPLLSGSRKGDRRLDLGSVDVRLEPHLELHEAPEPV